MDRELADQYAMIEVDIPTFTTLEADNADNENGLFNRYRRNADSAEGIL